jgi:hypothetical protein
VNDELERMWKVELVADCVCCPAFAWNGGRKDEDPSG